MTTETKRKNSPDGLTRDKYFSLIEHAADGMAIIQDGVFKMVNTALTHMSGYDKKELLGMPFTQLLTPQSQKLTMERYQARLAGKKVRPVYEIKAITKDGAILDIEINAALTEYEGRVADEVIVRDVTERKQVEEALKESQEFNSSLLENSPNPIFVTNPDTSVKYVNPAFEKLTDFTLAEIAGRKAPYPWWPEERREEMTATFKNAMVTGGRRSERIFQKRNGERFWVALNSAPVMHKGELIYFLIAWLDITERKKAEDKIRKTEQEKTAILNSMNELVVYQDTEHRIIWTNTIAAESVGMIHEQLVGRHCYEIWPQRDKPCVGCPVAKARQTGKPQEAEITTPDGRVWFIRGYPMRDANGAVIGLLEVALDITESKQAEETLKLQKAYFQQLFDNSPEAIVLVDSNQQIVNANKGFEALFGYTLKEIKGQSISKALIPEDRAKEAIALGKYISNNKAHRKETVRKRKDGKLVDVSLLGYPIRFSDKIVGAYIIYTDITERKQAKEALQTEKNKLQSVIDAMADGLSIQDKDFNIIYQNGPSQMPFGAHLGEKCYRVYAGRETACEDCPVEQAFKDGKSRTVEKKHVSPSGEVSFWENTANPIRDSNGNIVSCLEITRDVTERKKAGQALADETTRRRILIDQSLDGIVVLDENAKVYEANQKFAEMLGYTPEEVRELHTWDWDTQWSREELLEMGRKVDETGFQVETYHRRKDGTTIDVEISINGAMCSGQKLIFCVSRDITERKQAEETLQTEKNKLQTLIDAMEDGLNILDKDYNIIFQNEPVRRLYGDRTGEKCYRVYEGREKICDGCPVEKAFKDGESHTSERKIIAPSGEVAYWENTASPIKDANGKVVSCLEIVRNITKRKRVEQLQHGENYVLTLLGQEAELSELLDAIVRLGEDNDPSIKGSVLLWDSSKELLFQASAPSLPDDYKELLANGVPTGPKAGSCGTAAYRKERVIITDIANNPLFKPFEEVVKRAVNNGLLAVWSQPIISSDGELLGTIANYSNKVGEPSADNLMVLEWSARIAAIAIERKQAEEALRQSEKKYKNLAETTSDMIWETNEKGTFTFVSPRIKDILGYEASEVIGKTRTLDLTKKAEAQKWLKRFKEINAKKEPFFGFEIAHLHKNGTPVLFEISGIPTFDNAGNFKGYVGVNKDITERKRMEEQLREEREQLDAQNEELRTINEELQATEEELQHSQERLERMFESVTDGISVINLNGVITKVNQRTVEIHGFASEDEMLGRNAFDLVAPRDHERIVADMRQALKEGLITGGEYTMLRADSSEFPGELSTSVLKNGLGKAVGHISTVRDITERKQAEEREKRLEQELNLAGRLASIGQLAAGIAHEINNPLTGVIGFSHLMLSRDIPEDMKQDLQVINSEAQRVAKIVENLLVFAHQRKTGREYVFINDIITKVLELRAYEMKVNNIEVETQLDPNLPLTMADTGQLQQVFLNIVLNAEYSMKKAHHKGNLLVKTEQINGNIRTSLTDNGSGISRENLDKIFNPFFTTKEVGKGTGLGLSICHGIITQHNGRIYAQSESGKGAAFVIELPIAAEPAQAGKAKVTQKESQKPRGAKILVVDDEAAILTFLHRLLTEWGHRVETINNADAALERLKTERYSLILLDIKLPGMSGIELYRHIEEIAPALTRRVMFITGDIMEGATRDFLEKAGVSHITKPIDIEELKKVMNNALNQTQVAAKASG